MIKSLFAQPQAYCTARQTDAIEGSQRVDLEFSEYAKCGKLVQNFAARTMWQCAYWCAYCVSDICATLLPRLVQHMVHDVTMMMCTAVHPEHETRQAA